MRTVVLKKKNEGFRAAMESLVSEFRKGALVAFPTETVYGLGADPDSDSAIASVFRIKERDAGKPLTVHISSKDVVFRFAFLESEEQRLLFEVLTDHFWPGPLTVILRKKEGISDLLTGGLDTVAFRFPSHPTALEWINRCGGAVAGTSANRSGGFSASTAKDVMGDLSGYVDYVIEDDGGILGLESTVISLVSGLRILRQGVIGAEMIQRIIKEYFEESGAVPSSALSSSCASSEGGVQRSVLESKSKVRFYDSGQVTEVVQQLLTDPHTSAVLFKDSVYYNIRPILENPDVKKRIRMVSRESFVTKVYKILRSLDSPDIRHIYIPSMEQSGIGASIRDLLTR